MTDTVSMPSAWSWKASPARAGVALLAVLLGLVPLIGLSNLPFIDMPNHLARMYVLAEIGSDENLSRYYTIEHGLFPYLGIRGFFAALSPFFGIETIGHLFAIVAALMPAVGGMALAKAIHGRITLVSLAGFAFVLNALLSFGFLNYLFSVGLVLMALALWIRLDGVGQWLRLALFLFCVVPIAGVAHLLSAGVLFGLIGAYELGRVFEHKSPLALRWPDVARLLPLAVLTLPILLLLFLAVPSSNVGASGTIFGGLLTRAEALWSPFALGRSLNEICIGLLAAVPICIAYVSGLISLPARFRWMLALLAVCALLVPAKVAGIYVIHTRLPIVVLLLFLAAARVRLANGAQWKGAALALSFAAIVCVHVLVGTLAMRQQDARISELRAASRLIATGSRVLPAIDFASGLRPGHVPPLYFYHLASYLVIDRSVFLPTLFGMFSLGVTPEYERLFPHQTRPVDYALLSRSGACAKPDPNSTLPAWAYPSDYDYIVAFDQKSDTPQPAGTALLHKGSFFNILKVLPCAGAAPHA